MLALYHGTKLGDVNINANVRRTLREAGRGGGFGFEGGDGLDEARNGEGIADTAGAANTVESAATASERDGEFDERGDAGAVDLRNVIEIDDNLAGTFLQELLSEIVEVLAGLADGEAAVDVKVVDTTGLARIDLKWRIKRHERFLSSMSTVQQRLAW